MRRSNLAVRLFPPARNVCFCSRHRRAPAGGAGMEMENMTLVRPDPLDTSDVDGARPKPLPIRLRTNHPFNTNADIEYSSPQFAQTHGKFYTQRNSTRCSRSTSCPRRPTSRCGASLSRASCCGRFRKDWKPASA